VAADEFVGGAGWDAGVECAEAGVAGALVVY